MGGSATLCMVDLPILVGECDQEVWNIVFRQISAPGMEADNEP